MTRLTPLDELLAHQTPEPIAEVAVHHPYWRESYFFVAHHPQRLDDMVILTLATFPQRGVMDSLQMGRVQGERLLGRHERPLGDQPHRADVGAARVDIVQPFEEVRLYADPEVSAIGMDLTFRARTKPYGLRRGTMKVGHEIVWDQSHMLQSGTYSGTYTVNGRTFEVDRWWGQRDHSWGIRDHGRCPLWLWFQVQLPNGSLGCWHWEYANGAFVYSDGCWMPADGGEPVPMVRLEHEMEWVGADGAAVAYGTNGDDVVGLRGTATWTLADGQRITVQADGTFDRPYEPFHRGGLSQMRVRTDDGREGTGIFEVTGARHHRYFPDTVLHGTLPG